LVNVRVRTAAAATDLVTTTISPQADEFEACGKAVRGALNGYRRGVGAALESVTAFGRQATQGLGATERSHL
jgi:hypothetical protein